MSLQDNDSDIEELVLRAAGPPSGDSVETVVRDAVRRGRRRLVRRRLAVGVVAAAVVGLVTFAGSELIGSGRTDSLTVAAPPTTAPSTAPALPSSAPVSPVRDLTITYPDGTTVTWPGPARGEGWVVHPEFADEVPSSPGVELTSWDRTVRDAVFGGGWNEELGVLVGSDGELSYARSTGVSNSFAWASGPELPDMDLDPCSPWPGSSIVEQPAEGITCRVLTVDGRPVVVAEQSQQGSSGGMFRPAGVTAFTVRPDGTAVFLSQSSVDGEPVRSGEELARAALTLTGP